jgi:hypothetical protein
MTNINIETVSISIGFPDFFKYLSEIDESQISVIGMESNIYYSLGSFNYKAKQAYNEAVEAIEDAKKGFVYTTDKDWSEIYGSKFGN